jgi:hypothetical protein
MPVAKPIRFNDLYPPPPEGRENVQWQGDDADPANVSANYVKGGGGILADVLASRPAAGTERRIFIPIDQPIGQPDFYWDSGTAWIPFVDFRPLYPPSGGQQYLSILTVFGGNHV